MSTSRKDRAVAPDATLAYQQWDELFGLGLRMALGDSAAERKAGLERLARAQRRALAERDAMWTRVVRALGRLRGQ
ncbi:MAG: hypothetical protein ACHQ1G_02200 [Planctomycetota bacterium]